ncbi:hypothetical protein MAH1_24210 [Sessilibacter sp. MAH1]
MFERNKLSSFIRKALLVGLPALVLAACDGDDGRDGANGANGQDGANAAVAVQGFVQDGPVAGGSIYVFNRANIEAALAAADAAEIAGTSRAAALAAASPIATLENRNLADGENFLLNLSAENAGQAVFLVFDNEGAIDTTFNDLPINMESIAIVAESGQTQQINVNPFSSAITQLVIAQTTSDATVADIEVALNSSIQNVVDATDGDLPEGSNPITGLDSDLLAQASSELGEFVRVGASVVTGASDTAVNFSREEILLAYALDAADGVIDAAIPSIISVVPTFSGGTSASDILNAFPAITLAADNVVTPAGQATASRSPLHSAAQHLELAAGLQAEFLTRNVAHNADQFALFPAENPTHQIWCIEGNVEVLDTATGQRNPAVQRVSLSDGSVETILSGMDRCDGIRATPWGTVIATEETVDGSVYEILNPLSTSNITITNRGGAGEAATIIDASGADASGVVAKRTAMPTMAWEGLFVLENGVVVGGDELRPGSYELELNNGATAVSFGSDTDGGAIFKFIPTNLSDGTEITDLANSPLVSGSSFALQVQCTGGVQFGQGCEIGDALWVPVSAVNAREDANLAGATGYYRPEDLHLDPDFSNPENADEVRFCFANTGNRGADNFGEVICGTDANPADSGRNVTLVRFVEGDSELNAPDNLAFQPGTGILYVIEDNQHGDVWACLPDGDDQGLTSDGCVRVLSLNDTSAEPTGFGFNADGTEAWVSIQHSSDNAFPLVNNYRTDDIVRITGFSAPTAIAADITSLAEQNSQALFGFGTPITASNANTVDRQADITTALNGADLSNGFGNGEDASAYVSLAGGLSATFLTRTASEWWDQHDLYPLNNPTHLIGCIEESRGIVDDGTANKYKPSVQRVNLTTGVVETIARGMDRCDGIRTTPWGTVLATEESADGAAYEILDPLTTTNVVIVERGDAGMAATIEQGDANGVPTSVEASNLVVKRTAMPTMAWEGLFVLDSGVVVGGDELRPGSYDQFFLADGTIAGEDDGSALLVNSDTDGGAIFKFVPATPRTLDTQITNLNDSPFVAGSTYAMQVSCQSSRQQAGQGCEVGNASWIEVDAANARVQANGRGATGYYRPEDMHRDPMFVDATNPDAVRFCWTNTGRTGSGQVGEVICGIDSAPLTASSDLTVSVNRFVEGDEDFNAPDNFAFQPVTGIAYVIEDDSDGDVWACLPDGDDRDIKTDGCVRMLSIAVQGAEPTGFSFSQDGTRAYLSLQHANGEALLDGNDTDDLLIIEGFSTNVDFSSFGTNNEATLHSNSAALFGFEGPLAESSTVGDL